MGETVIALTAKQIVILSFLATGGLFLFWVTFWYYAGKGGEKVSHILLNPAFFRTVTVMGVIAAAVVLGLAGRLEGKLVASILTGIAGYVLGSVQGNLSKKNGKE